MSSRDLDSVKLEESYHVLMIKQINAEVTRVHSAIRSENKVYLDLVKRRKQLRSFYLEVWLDLIKSFLLLHIDAMAYQDVKLTRERLRDIQDSIRTNRGNRVWLRDRSFQLYSEKREHEELLDTVRDDIYMMVNEP